jgi:hypothetical protein
MSIQKGLSRAWDGITHTMPRFSAKLIIMSAVLGAMIVAGFTLFIWDMDFYARLTPTGQDELNYQRVGFALRTMAIAGLPLYLLAREIKAPISALSSVLVLWVLSTLLCLVAALGFLSEAQDYHFRKATAVTDTQAAVVATVDAQLLDLDKEADDVKSNRNGLIEGARTSMSMVLNDGDPRNDDLSTFESQIATYNTEAQAQLNAIQLSKDGLRKQALDATVAGTEETVGDSAVHPVFTMISSAMPGNDTWWRDMFTLVSAVTLELLVAVGFGAWWAIVRHGRVEKLAPAYSASVPEGMVDLRMTEAEWAAYEAALDVHSNIKDGAQKGARTRRRGKKIKNSEEYNREVVEVFMARRRKGETMDNILQARGLTLGEFLATYDRSILSDDERELLLGEFDEAFEDEPELDDAEQMTNGADQDTTDEEEGAEDEGDRTIS